MKTMTLRQLLVTANFCEINSASLQNSSCRGSFQGTLFMVVVLPEHWFRLNMQIWPNFKLTPPFPTLKLSLASLLPKMLAHFDAIFFKADLSKGALVPCIGGAPVAEPGAHVPGIGGAHVPEGPLPMEPATPTTQCNKERYLCDTYIIV